MLFSSISFIYYFLPLLLIIYFITPKKYRNIPLLIGSLVFYFLGEPIYILVLILSCIINYYLSKIIYKKHSKLFLVISLIYNIGNILYFKYTNFFIDNINNIFNLNIKFLEIIMPIGISFYTFQIIGYIVDVYNRKHEPAKNVLNFMMYVTLFPQLIAGPIVRYSDVEKEIEERTITIDKFSQGITRFIIGLSKKVLIANVLGELITLLTIDSFISVWLKPILFTLQIYYDFSGYSDMAIGLGHMLGFTFLENFNYPLIAKSITDFWRRWHISLSSWFKDYVYIPLGGSRVSKIKWIRNLSIVWLLTGFWHGASWNFIIWGIFFLVVLLLEKLFLGKYLEKTKVIKYIYTSIIVIISFLIFSTENVSDILNNLSMMFTSKGINFINAETLYYLKSNIILLLIGIIGATPLPKNIYLRLKETKLKIVLDIIEPFILIGLLALVTSFLIDDSFNPFLYFRF